MIVPDVLRRFSCRYHRAPIARGKRNLSISLIDVYGDCRNVGEAESAGRFAKIAGGHYSRHLIVAVQKLTYLAGAARWRRIGGSGRPTAATSKVP